MQLFCNHQSQHTVTKKFQSFVGMFCIRAGMGQRTDQKPAVCKDMPKLRLQRLQGDLCIRRTNGFG